MRELCAALNTGHLDGVTKTCADFQEQNQEPEGFGASAELRQAPILTHRRNDLKPGLNDRRLIEKYK